MRRELIAHRRAARPGDPRRRGLRRSRVRRTGGADGDARSRRADHFVFEPVEGVSRAGMARRAGWRSARRRGSTARSPRSRSWRTDGCAVPGRCSTRVVAALTGDRSHQVTFRQRARASARELTTERLNAIEGMRCVAPRGAFYAMPQVTLPPGRTDAGLRARRCCARPAFSCVYGSGFGTAPEDGFFRVVFLASPAELGAIYDDIADFTRELSAHVNQAALVPDRRPRDPRRLIVFGVVVDDRGGAALSGCCTRSAARCCWSTSARCLRWASRRSSG